MLAGRNVLVVEDDHAGATLFALMVRLGGATVEVAHNAEEALVAINAFVPDIVVLDLVLPRMSGVVLATMLSRDPRTRHAPIIAVSAFDRDQAEPAALAAGCVGFITKPVDPEQFANVVAQFAAGGTR